MEFEVVLDEFRAADALLEGHFVLSSGKHSDRYLQCARVMMEPARAARLLAALAGGPRGSARDARRAGRPPRGRPAREPRLGARAAAAVLPARGSR